MGDYTPKGRTWTENAIVSRARTRSLSRRRTPKSSSRSATGSARCCILRSGGVLDTAAAARALSRTGEQITAAARRLSGAGLLTAGDVPLPGPDELPVYRTEDILRRSADDGAFRALLGECQRVLGHTLSSADLNTLTPIEAMNLLFELQKKVRG